MKRFKKNPENLISVFSEKNKILGKVKQDEPFVMESFCIHSNIKDLMRLKNALEFKDGVANYRVANVTGPVYIEGAKPGQTLEVDIIKTKLTSDTAYFAAVTNYACFKGKFDVPQHKPVKQDQNFVYFNEKIKIPTRIMLGKIGTTPTGKPMPSAVAGPYGGNYDNKDICAGAKVFLPIFVEGALLAIGDLHAAQGDGELISGVETEGEVTLMARVRDDIHFNYPVVVNEREIQTMAPGKTHKDAATIALDEMAKILMKQLDLSYLDAAFLLCAIGDVRNNQVTTLSSVRVCVPRSIVPAFD